MILLMEEILHQLTWQLSRYLQGFLYMPGGAGFLPSTVQPGVQSFSISFQILLPFTFWSIVAKPDAKKCPHGTWNYIPPPRSNSHHQDYYISKEAPSEPFIDTGILGWGV